MRSGFLKSLTIIHTALLIGATLFTVFATLMPQQPHHYTLPAFDAALLGVGFALFISSQVIGSMVFTQRLRTAAQLNTLSEKLNLYRAAYITRLAMAEGAVMFFAVASMVTGNLLASGLAALGLVALMLQKPGVTGISEALNLSHEERLILESE